MDDYMGDVVNIESGADLLTVDPAGLLDPNPTVLESLVLVYRRGDGNSVNIQMLTGGHRDASLRLARGAALELVHALTEWAEDNA